MDTLKLVTDQAYYQKEYNKQIKRIEKKIGMSIAEYQVRLKNLITPSYIAYADRQKAILDDWLASGKEIKDRKGNILQLAEDEYFVQCFTPNEPIRNELPRCWFISNKLHLVSTHQNKVRWVPDKEGKNNRGSHKYSHPFVKKKNKPKERAGKSIKIYNLAALVFNPSCAFGKVAEDIALFGSFAFGVGYGFWANGHHRRRCIDYPEMINDPFNIQFLRGYVHGALRDARVKLSEITTPYNDPETQPKILAILNDLIKVLDFEVPGMAVKIFLGERFNLDGSFKDNKGEYSLDLLTADEAEKELPKEIREQLKQSVLNRLFNQILEEQGA